MQVTIIYDNTTQDSKLKADWGFSCMIEGFGSTILFDTGAKAKLFFHNIKQLNIDLNKIAEIFISHYHHDHIGGLEDLLNLHPMSCCLPYTEEQVDHPLFKYHKERTQLHPGIFTTGLLKEVEQSLFYQTSKGLVLIVGCSHPSVRTILESVKDLGNVYALIGGLHGFDELDLLEPIEIVCPTHCTQKIKDIQTRFPDKYIQGGAGAVIKLPD
jgi:7,8-dihydropterin-6-yl-methyl-4-(beta-D-ribofuranosyl)aminobenzene 5'-phosphate synthase